MKRGEKKQKFHDNLLQMLYPPPPPKEDNQESIDTLDQNLNMEYIPDEWDEDRGSTSSTDVDEDEEDDGPKKLTRAQRKRLRKKKLKESASRRRKIIGPLLPNASGGGCDGVEEEPQDVRQNAAEKDGTATPADKPELEDSVPGSKQNNLKQRRIAKKLASERMRQSRIGNSNQDSSHCDKGKS